jgi:hypothetical protein
MTLLSRTVLFVFGTVMVLGAMLLTVHWAHAIDQDAAEKAIELLQAIKKYHCQDADHCPGGAQFDKDGNYIPPTPVSPQRAQINRCIAYGIRIGRGVKTTDVKDPDTKRQLENRDDWLYFCMSKRAGRSATSARLILRIIGIGTKPAARRAVLPTTTTNVGSGCTICFTRRPTNRRTGCRSEVQGVHDRRLAHVQSGQFTEHGDRGVGHDRARESEEVVSRAQTQLRRLVEDTLVVLSQLVTPIIEHEIRYMDR